MDIYRTISTKFWNSDIWLPPNTTWEDIAPGADPNIQHADSTHLLIYPIPLALLMFVLRRFLENNWFTIFGKYLGVKAAKPKQAPPNKLLERAFSKSKYPKHDVVKGIAKQLDWSEIQVQRWLRTKRAQNKPSTLVKFTECCWRCLYYAIAFASGCYVLWDKEWLWVIQKCWSNYPHQSVSNDVWWYYMLSLAFYWSLCFSQFVDVKRSDFWQMFLHHIATILLMSFSWVCNMTRIGSLVIIVHDFVDIILDGAKIAKYAGYQRLCDAMFVVFLVMWIGSRIILYPNWIIRNTMIDAPKIVPMFPAYYIFNGLLLGLLALHVFWTYLILRILVNTVAAGTMERDIRSSSEDDSD